MIILKDSTLHGMGQQYKEKLNRAIDQMDSVYFLTFSNQAWLSIRLDIIGVVLALITALLVITNRFNLNLALRVKSYRTCCKSLVWFNS